MAPLFFWFAFVVTASRKTIPTARRGTIGCSDDLFEKSMQSLGFSNKTQEAIRSKVSEAGFESLTEPASLARDFIQRPEVFSDLLQRDFGIQPALLAHRIRAVAMDMLAQERRPVESKANGMIEQEPRKAVPINNISEPTAAHHGEEKKPIFKSVKVNEQAKRRRQKVKSSGGSYDYGLPSNCRDLYPTLAEELDDFYAFMTRPSTKSQQDDPIRPATAKTYLRHARLFLGWHVNVKHETCNDTSMHAIIPDKRKESAESIIDFIIWLRSERNISVSYEANLLRGLIKFLKFRFAAESKADPSYGDKSFDDIPLIREIRKLHRDANKRQRLAPKSSDEERKWLSWAEYLGVVQAVKNELVQLLDNYRSNEKPTEITPFERKIATLYQHYLVLAFFANVPDRQRTIRELEIGRSFVKDSKQNLWVIKHGVDDYKTGKHYGARPPLVLNEKLVPAIDDFLDRWRPCLQPTSDFLFVQPRTGKPLTQDSVYQTVARNCYKHTGKKTNPHLLRDMIVTHVKQRGATEQELEALALYMGHSLEMQRNSYDRRTLTRKVAPAVELIQSVNNKLDESTGR